MKYITSKDNKTWKQVVSLEKRKYRDQHGQYLVEGVRAVRDMAEANLLQSLWVSEDCVDNLKDLLNDYHNLDIYCVSSDLYDRIAHSVQSQGIIGVAQKVEWSLERWQPKQGLYVWLDQVQDPGNLGTIIRTAVAGGVKGLFLAAGTVDPYNDKTVRSTMSALGKIPIYQGCTVDDFHRILAAGVVAYGTGLDKAVPYRDITYTTPALLVLGNEGNGVRPDMLQACHHRITIPMYGPIESLNVAVAAGLCIFAIQEQQ